MQVINLCNYFQTLAGTHCDIKTFKTGDLCEVAVGGDDQYIQLWLEQIFQQQISGPVLTWSVNFLILAKQLRDESDEKALLDKTHTIGHQIIEKIKLDKVYGVGSSFNAVSFTMRFDDCLAGWRFEITMQERRPGDRCTIDGIFNTFCDYTAEIRGTQSSILQSISTTAGPLPLPALPITMGFNNNIAVEVANLESQLIGLGYDAELILQDFGRFVYIDIIIHGTKDIFINALGTDFNEAFTAGCSCEWYIVLNSDQCEIMQQITMGSPAAPLPLSTLPIDIRETNLNVVAELELLKTELTNLGHPMTYTIDQQIDKNIVEIFISDNCNVFNEIICNSGIGTFSLNCN